MKKILFATIVALSITFISCTTDATEGTIEETTNSNNNTINQGNVLLNQKPSDTIGGQAGNTPPPPPPVTP